MTDLLISLLKDKRYENHTAHDLKVMRANMINRGGFTKYEMALIQYWIMKKENRLSDLGNSQLF